MKKLFALLAVALGVVACQKDQADFGVNLGGEQEVTINVALSAETRASSALGSLDNDVLKTHDLRYILEIYQGTHCLRMEKFTTEDNVAFPVRLAPGRAYNFVVWADFVKKEGARNAEDADLYYETSANLQNISIIDGAPMNEARDAFYGKATLAATANLASLSTIELTRPLAKIRVVTTDVQDLVKIGVALPTEAAVAYQTDINNKFNALTGVASSDNATEGYTFLYNKSPYTVDTEKDNEMTLFADYLFVNANATTKFNLDIKDFERKPFTTEIPVVANQITTIKGDILTNGGDINVDINDKFDTETIYLEGNVTLTENLNVNRPLVVAAGKTAVLNLNDKKIINTNPSENYGEGEGIVVYGNLTIEGEGTIQGTSMAVWARGNNNAVVTIKGGKFVGCQEGLAKGGRSVIYASSGNVVNIYGGEFKAEAADETSFAATQYPVLNVADNNGMINVYGGRFYKQNPAAPGTEPAAWNANHPNGFVANGYVSVADGDWFEVVKLTKNEVKSILSDAVAAGETNIVIDAGNENIGDLNGGLTKALVPAGTTLTIRNATIEGRSYGNKIDGDVIFENCVFTHTGAYSIHFDGGQGSVAFKECELYGWNSFGSTLKSVSFEDCSLKGNGTYALIRSYVDMTLTNCTIDLSNANHADEWPEGVEVVEDATLTENNVAYIVKNPEALKATLETAGAAGAGNTTIVFAENTTLDMTNTEWKPIKVDGYNGADIVTIDGKGSVITGLKAPLFAGGFAGGSGIVIKNLTIKDSNIVSNNTIGSGAFIESVDSMAKIELTNCHLLNSTVTGGAGSRTGGLIGWTAGYNNVNDGPVKTYVTIDNCSVVGCTIQCDGSVGGINGHAGNNAWTYTTIKNCTIKNNTLASTDDGEWRVGVVVGTANVGEVTISNITESGNTLTQTGKTAPEGLKRNYYGRFVPGTTGKLVIDGEVL